MATLEQAAQDVLNQEVLFHLLPEKERNTVASFFTVQELNLGDEVGRQDTEIDGYFYVYSGSLRKRRLNEAGKRVSIGKIETKESVGHISLIRPVVWEFDLAAAEKNIVLRLDSGKFRAFVESTQGLAPLLKRHIALLEVGSRIKSFLGKAKYDAAWLGKVLQHISLRRVGQNEFLFQQSDADEDLYYIENGTGELTCRHIEGEINLGKARSGDFLGEPVVLTNDKQWYSVRALSVLSLITIPKLVVHEIFRVNPKLQTDLAERLKNLKAEEERQVAALSRREGVQQEVSIATGEEGEAAQGKKIYYFPWLRQHDERDCGAACLTMIAKYYGLKLRMGHVRDMANVSVEGATISSVCSAAEQIGFRARGLKCTYNVLRRLQLPCIIHWEGFHYVVLYRISRDTVWLADPAIGRRKLSKKEFEVGWTTHCIELEPTPKLHETEQAKGTISHFINYLRPHKWTLLETFIGSMILNILGLASPIFVQTIVDGVIVHRDVSLLEMMLGGMVLIAIFSTLTSSVQDYLLAHMTARVDKEMLRDFFRHLLDLPMNFFQARKSGDIISRFGENTTIRGILTGTTITVLLNCIMLVLYVLLMFVYSSQLSVVLLLFIPVFILLSVIFTPIFKNFANKVFYTNADQTSYMVESIHGIETIKATGKEFYILKRWEEAFLKMVKLGFQSQKLTLIQGSVGTVINTALSIIMLGYGARLVMDSQLTVGGLMAFMGLMGSVMGSVMSLVGLWGSFQTVKVAMERISDVNDVKTEREIQKKAGENAAPIILASCTGKVEFQNVSFRYGGSESPPVLNGINLAIEPGKTCALVGRSGCGKTTMAKMILGFNLATEGIVSIDGQDLRLLDLQALRRHIGIVLQDSFLFSATISENIAFGEAEPDEDRVREAALIAGAHEFIVNFAHGYRTIVGERGLVLSGGQRQRVCIARALYRRPKIIIFDEATSALDTESERRITENMASILSGRTAVVIAHRLSTIRNADTICVLDRGVIAERGTHDELLEKRGLYYELARTQIAMN